ncbi:MAG TPA: hypothetical protein VFG72_02255 [Marmoricola sp.]|nr:hypothetical protein [Marmoricola sp.]
MTDRGERRARRGRVLPSLLGAVVAVAAWVLLVVVAVDFGNRGRDGDAVAWVFLGLAGLGAAACLVLALFLGRQTLVAVGVLTEYRPRRARR